LWCGIANTQANAAQAATCRELFSVEAACSIRQDLTRARGGCYSSEVLRAVSDLPVQVAVGHTGMRSVPALADGICAASRSILAGGYADTARRNGVLLLQDVAPPSPAFTREV